MNSPESFLDQLVSNHSELETCRESVQKAYELIADSYSNNGKLLICGNGGSASDADHIVGELMKGFESTRKLPESDLEKLKSLDPENGELLYNTLQGSLPAIALGSQSAIVTAVLNDQGGEYVFAQQILGYGNENDCLLAISTSGNSANVLHAITIAKLKGLKVIGLSSDSGGKMKERCDLIINAPSPRTARIQEFHLPIYHALCLMLEARFFNE